MILVDTSVWAKHIDRGVGPLADLLSGRQVLAHPFVIGEIAMGNLRHRDRILRDLHDLPKAVVGTDQEALQLIETARLFGTGMGYIDAHLLLATRLSPDALLWTFDKRMRETAIMLDVAFDPLQ